MGQIDPSAACRYQQDADLFASWKVDYLKFDGCAGPKTSIEAMKVRCVEHGMPIRMTVMVVAFRAFVRARVRAYDCLLYTSDAADE